MMADDLPLTRRQILQRAGLIVAGAAVPGAVERVAHAAGPQRAAAAAQRTAAVEHPISDVMVRLSTYMSAARDRALPDRVLEQTKWHVLDTFAAMVSGSELAPGRSAITFARAYGGKEVATVVGDTVLCGPMEAALANGVLAHADETDDSWPGGWHPGCNVVPAALAAAEQFGASGAHFARAVALGYDIGARILITLRPGLANSHKATHAIAGVFGAAAAAGCAASLDAQKMRWMLDYTAQQSSGLASWFRDTDHIEKGFVFGGMPARSGVTSALLVHAGWNGVDDVLSGRDNFLLANAPQANAALLVEKLGERYEVVGHDNQALDRGHAHPGSARRDGGAVEATADRSGPGATDPRAVGPGLGGGQQRAARYQHSVRDGLDADRQDGHVSIDPRQTAHAGPGDSSSAGDGAARSARGTGSRLPERRSSRLRSPTAPVTCRTSDPSSAPLTTR